MPKKVEKSKRGRGISTKNPKVNLFGNVWVRYRQALVHNGWYMIGKVPMYQLDMIYALQEWGGSMTSKMSTCGYVPNLCPRGTFTFFFSSKKSCHFFGFFLRLPLACKPTINVSTVLLLVYHHVFLLIFSVSLNLTTTWISLRRQVAFLLGNSWSRKFHF